MDKGNSKQRFQLEMMEPRVLLSDVGATAAAAPPPESSHGISISVPASVLTESLQPSEGQPDLQLDEIFGTLLTGSDNESAITPQISVLDTRKPAAVTVNSRSIRPLVERAVDQLSGLGFDPEQLEKARDVQVRIADLPGWTISEASSDGVAIDRGAGGYGWYIDE